MRVVDYPDPLAGLRKSGEITPRLRARCRELYTGQRVLDDALVAELDALDRVLDEPPPKPDPPWAEFWAWTAADDAG